MRRPTSPRDRGQAFTIEAVVAALIVVGSLLFALQIGGVTSQTASTSSEGLVEQRAAVAAGVLDTATADRTVRATLLYWDETDEQFHNVSEIDESFYTVGPPTAFGRHLNGTLGDRSIAYNVNVLYRGSNGTVERRPVVRSGVPTDDAARATRVVTLYDDDRLQFANGTASDTNLTEASYYFDDRYPGGPVYGVVRVEVVVWST